MTSPSARVPPRSRGGRGAKISEKSPREGEPGFRLRGGTRADGDLTGRSPARCAPGRDPKRRWLARFGHRRRSLRRIWRLSAFCEGLSNHFRKRAFCAGVSSLNYLRIFNSAINFEFNLGNVLEHLENILEDLPKHSPPWGMFWKKWPSPTHTICQHPHAEHTFPRAKNHGSPGGQGGDRPKKAKINSQGTQCGQKTAGQAS